MRGTASGFVASKHRGVRVLVPCWLLLLCGFAPPGEGPGHTSPGVLPPVACLPVATYAYKTDHLPTAENKCYAWWSRPVTHCVKTTVHTFVLGDSANGFWVWATDDANLPGAVKLASNAAECSARKVTITVYHELAASPNVWVKLKEETRHGVWIEDSGTCLTWTHWVGVAISTQTTRVRTVSQAIRQDGTYAGTETVGSYTVMPGECDEN